MTRTHKIYSATFVGACLLILSASYVVTRCAAAPITAFVWVLHEVPGRSAFHSWQNETLLSGTTEQAIVSQLHTQGFVVIEHLDAKQLRRLQTRSLAPPAAALVASATGAQVAVQVVLQCREQSAPDAAQARVHVVLNGNVQRLHDDALLARATEEATVDRQAGEAQDSCEQAAASIAPRLAQRLLAEAALRLGQRSK